MRLKYLAAAVAAIAVSSASATDSEYWSAFEETFAHLDATTASLVDTMNDDGYSRVANDVWGSVYHEDDDGALGLFVDQYAGEEGEGTSGAITDAALNGNTWSSEEWYSEPGYETYNIYLGGGLDGTAQTDTLNDGDNVTEAGGYLWESNDAPGISGGIGLDVLGYDFGEDGSGVGFSADGDLFGQWENFY